MPSHPKDRHTVMYIYWCYIYCKLPKIHPPFLHATLRQKWGEAFAWILILCRVDAPPTIPHNRNDCCSFLDERQRRWTCTQEISGACVETKPRGIEATCIVRGQLHTSSRFQCEQQKPLAEASEWGYSINFLCVRVYKHKQWRLKPVRRSIRGVHMQEKDLCKNLGLKKRKGVCSNGAYFRDLTVVDELLLRWAWARPTLQVEH